MSAAYWREWHERLVQAETSILSFQAETHVEISMDGHVSASCEKMLNEFSVLRRFALRELAAAETKERAIPEGVEADGRVAWTIREAAEKLGCGYEFLRLLIGKGEFPHFYLGSEIRISVRVLDAFMHVHTRWSRGASGLGVGRDDAA